jgi:hypothetical protein
MIVSKKYAKQLIKRGKAKIEGNLKPDGLGIVYVILTRYDLQRVDHFRS